MNNAKSMSLRARINNFSKRHGVSPQLALQSFFAERFLARIAQSPYAANLAIKGGTLMSAILGIEQRTTMDVDATIIGIRADEAKIVEIVETIAAAVKNTFANRNSKDSLASWRTTINTVKASAFQRDQWSRYTLKTSSAHSLLVANRRLFVTQKAVDSHLGLCRREEGRHRVRQGESAARLRQGEG